MEYAMPPVGLTEHHAQIGGQTYQRLTWRCDVEGCWYVCTPTNKAALQELTDRHKMKDCPTPPRRESLPSGLAEIEKLWREVDDVVDVLRNDVTPMTYRGMSGAELKAYVKGLAFSIVMKDKDLFPDIRSVAVESVRRWKMRNNQLAYEPTPTRHVNNFSGIGQSGGWQPVNPTQAGPATKKTTRKAPPVVTQVIKPDLPPATVASVKAALSAGMFSPADIATMYGVTEDQVKKFMA